MLSLVMFIPAVLAKRAGQGHLELPGQVPDCTLTRLHDVIQTCLGREDYHLHAFQIGGQEYSPPDPDGRAEGEDERKVKLSQVVAQRYKKFTYTYDFGDSWEHLVQVEK